jgi:hypothetical protein
MDKYLRYASSHLAKLSRPDIGEQKKPPESIQVTGQFNISEISPNSFLHM